MPLLFLAACQQPLVAVIVAPCRCSMPFKLNYLWSSTPPLIVSDLPVPEPPPLCTKLRAPSAPTMYPPLHCTAMYKAASAAAPVFLCPPPLGSCKQAHK